MRRLKGRVLWLVTAVGCLALSATSWGQDSPNGNQVSFVDSAGDLPATLGQDNPAPQSATQEQQKKELEDLRKILKETQEKLDKIAPATPETPQHAYGPEKTPMAFGDMSWAPAGYAPSESSLHFGPFTGEVRIDGAVHMDLQHPSDHSISGSSEEFRSNELQLTQIGFGGDFYYDGVQARLMTQFGMYSQTTPRNDPSASRGEWNLDNAYRYISEAYGGYHINYMHGLNIQGGIFMSYVGLWSYYNFDNWTYQPSYVSSNTPWFFNGFRVQFYPSEKLKIEPWFINGWQAYGMFNHSPGLGIQVRWWPDDSFSILGNQYTGNDDLGANDRRRFHTDDSMMWRYYENKDAFLDRMAMSFTFDYGFETGDNVHANTQYFLGFMTYNRWWFYHNKFGFTVGGGWINNPGRYLVLEPPINGATAATGSPFFTENPGDQFKAWDYQMTLDYMPTENITFRIEFTRRFASVPYWSGPGGVTPPATAGGVQGTPGQAVPGVWAGPDLVKSENIVSFALMVRF